ncbi:RteC domain-containing protein [Chitinophaga sancti]|uniref:RteC domain-containing protein n=1 Tax=Chitinophaga sancti TaxID=1004 RepID=A0A1K1R4S1_9BACT|nr:RteC domain-containing protein [Chitinophaga sancti]WQD64256.1 RteC domain-containing protein [Chitinophaga sancti]WQG90120.1 RteC domain-containing protein [Chitinophaga sancti]SFW67013.1 RteC protein [Chitinophaga sancti]
MNKYYSEKINSLNYQINELIAELENPILLSEQVIELILLTLADLKVFVLKRGFKNDEEEIYFFKYQKPVIVSKLIYYNAIYKIETGKPYGTKRTNKYLKKELKKLKKFFDNNFDFYKYHRNNNDFLDDKLFLRGKHDIKLCLDTYYFESDHSFSTSHDYKVAKIMANDLIQLYLKNKIFITKKKALKDLGPPNIFLNWTGSKAGMIELIYALHYQGVFDNGSTDIRLIAEYFEQLFGVDLGNFYHTYLEIRNRKINRTKFLDKLRDTLIKKMDEQDAKQYNQ